VSVTVRYRHSKREYIVITPHARSLSVRYAPRFTPAVYTPASNAVIASIALTVAAKARRGVNTVSIFAPSRNCRRGAEPLSNDFVPLSNNFVPLSNNFVPLSNNFVPLSNNFVPLSNDFVPLSNDFVPLLTLY
jgi:hypothetical protein